MVNIKEYRAFIKQYKEKNCPKAYSTLKKAPLKKLAEKYGYEGQKEKPKKTYADYIKQYKEKNCPPYSNAKKAQLKRIAEKMGYTAQPVKEMKKKAPVKPKAPPPKVVKPAPEKKAPEEKKPEPEPDASVEAKQRQERIDIHDRVMREAVRDNLSRRELYRRAYKTGWTRIPLRKSKTEDLRYWVYVVPAMNEYSAKLEADAKKAQPVKVMKAPVKEIKKTPVIKKAQPVKVIKKTPEVKLSKPVLTQSERKARKERELFEKQSPLLHALTLIWRKADTLINTWVKDRYKPEYKRALPPIINAGTSEERQKMFNAWEKTKEKLIREIESQLKPLEDAYYEIIKKGEGVLTGNYRGFPSIYPRIRKHDVFIKKYYLKPPSLLNW